MIFHIEPIKLMELIPSTSETTNSYPPQEFCKNREAVRRSRQFLVDPVSSVPIWICATPLLMNEN